MNPLKGKLNPVKGLIDREADATACLGVALGQRVDFALHLEGSVKGKVNVSVCQKMAVFCWFLYMVNVVNSKY